MSLAAYYVAFASALAFVADMSVVEANTPDTSTSEYYQDWSLQYLDKLHLATKWHDDTLVFLWKMMKVDYLWWPILKETVKAKRPTVPYVDPYAEPVPTEYVVEDVLPFEIISTMMTANTFTGSDVQYAMDVLESAMACSALKHVSFQGLLLHTLLTKFMLPRDEQALFNQWLMDMTTVSIDRLTALERSQGPEQPITRARGLLIDLMHTLSRVMGLQTFNEKLYKICLEMSAEIKNTCAVPKGEYGHYSALVYNLNKMNRVEELKAHRTQLTDTMRIASEVYNVDLMIKYKGPIKIDAAIVAEEISDLNDDTLRKATAANNIQMKFLYLNLPIQTLSESQWITLSTPNPPKSPEPPTTTPQFV